MTNFYLVGKNFKSNGKLYERGTVITVPSEIRRFVLKVREGKILYIDLENQRSAYKFDILVQKYGLDKKAILAAANIPKANKAKSSRKRTNSKSNGESIVE